jgi:hypothetical protein
MVDAGRICPAPAPALWLKMSVDLRTLISVDSRTLISVDLKNLMSL